MGQIILKGMELIRPLLEGKRFLLVCGQTCKHLEMIRFFEELPHTEFSGFTPNPLYEQVCKGIDLFNAQNCELLVAVGGGSAMDVAKCIKLFHGMDPGVSYLEQKPTAPRIPLIAVPTTAGTGSESTRHAVIYDKGEKQSISHDGILPDYAVLEPSALETLPLYQKKCTMLDALCQAIESWWSVSSTDESREYSQKAVAGIRDNWKAYVDGTGRDTYEKMMEASNYAGRAINITTTTAPHAMSYKLTSLYHLPHGHAVALCMREVWSYMAEHPEDCVAPHGQEYLKHTLEDISSMADITWFCRLLEELDMACPKSDQKEKDVDILVRSVNPLRLKNHPVTFRTETMKKLYERIVKE